MNTHFKDWKTDDEWIESISTFLSERHKVELEQASLLALDIYDLLQLTDADINSLNHYIIH